MRERLSRAASAPARLRRFFRALRDLPEVEPGALAVTEALRCSGVEPEQVDYATVDPVRGKRGISAFIVEKDSERKPPGKEVWPARLGYRVALRRLP